MFRKSLYVILLGLSFLLIVVSCGKSKESYTIKGKLMNINDSIFFAARETGDSLFIDTVRVNHKGEFTFSKNIDTLTVVSLYFRNNTASPYVLVDKNWTVKIEGDVDYPDLIMAEGGDINNELTKFKKDNIEILKKRRDLAKQKGESFGSADSLSVDEYSVGLKNVDFELLNLVTNYIKSHPTKISSVILMDNFFKNEEYIERLSDGLEELKGTAYEFPLTIQLKAYRDQIRKSAVGSAAPEFSLENTNGKKVTIKELKDKYLFLSFVSTTCKACDAMLPHIIREHDKIVKHRKDVEFITIIKDVEDKPINEDDKKNIKWSIIPEYGGWSATIFEDYNIKEVPYNILISKEGEILERNVSVFNLDNKLNSYSSHGVDE